MAKGPGAINKTGAAIIMGAGLATFLAPFVMTDAPVKGRTDWAPIDLLMSRADLWRPAPPFHQHDVLYVIWFVYLLMIIGLLLLALPSPRMPLTVVAAIGSGLCLRLLRYAPRSVEWLLYGRPTQSRISQGDRGILGLLGGEGLQFGLAFYLFVAVMPLLILVFRTGRSVAD